MDEKKPDRFLDDLLDASLKRYSSVEPRAGLEERVLAHLHANPQRAPWLGWSWAARGAVAGVVFLAALLVFWQRSTPPAPAPAELARGSAPRVAPAVAPTAPSVVRTIRPTTPSTPPRAALTAAPRRESFPAPAPLSEQEELLLRFVAAAPGELLLAADNTRRGRPALEIEPLAVSDLVVEKLARNP